MRKGLGQNPGEQHHGRHLGRSGQEGGDRGRRALIDVRRPHVEGRGGHLEGQAADQEHQAEHHAHGGGSMHGGGDVEEPGRSGEAVDQRRAIEQEARRQGAQDEVFETRLRRPRIVPLERAHDIESQGLQLDPDIEADQVAGGDHHAHAQRRQQDQHRIFELGVADPGQPALAQHRGHGAGRIDDDLGEHRRPVRDEGALERRSQRSSGRQHRRRRQGQHRAPGHQGHAQSAGKGAHHQKAERRRRQKQLGLRDRQGAVETHQTLLPQPPTAERHTVTRLATDASVKLNTRCG